jgi:hypothetical protein
MSANLSRRNFTEAAGAAAPRMTKARLEGRAQTSAESQPKSMRGIETTFPDGFNWSVATSAFQVEDAVKGRRPRRIGPGPYPNLQRGRCC